MAASTSDHLAACRLALLDAVSRGRPPRRSTLVVRQAPPAPPAAAVAAQLAGLQVEDLQLCCEEPTAVAQSQAWMPLRLVQQAPQHQLPPQPTPPRLLPVVVLLHSTGNDKASLAAQQAEFARRGYLAATIDSRCVRVWASVPTVACF